MKRRKWQIAIRRQLWLVSAAMGVIVFAAGLGIDWLLSPPRRELLYSDAFTGAVAAILAYVALRYYYARQQDAMDRLRIIGDVNHHVRNALEVIVLSVAVRNDPELRMITESAIRRADWALREILPGATAASSSYPEVMPWVGDAPQRIVSSTEFGCSN